MLLIKYVLIGNALPNRRQSYNFFLYYAKICAKNRANCLSLFSRSSVGVLGQDIREIQKKSISFGYALFLYMYQSYYFLRK